MSKQIVFGCVYHWWRGDDLPELTSLPEFASRVITDKNLLASLHNITEDEIQARFDDAAHCYVAFLDDVPVGYGWVGTKEGLIRQGDWYGRWVKGIDIYGILGHYPIFGGGVCILICCKRFYGRNRRRLNVFGLGIMGRMWLPNEEFRRLGLSCTNS